MRKNYLLCYDIADPKRLYKVRRHSYQFTFGGQKSALQIPASKNEVKNILKELSKLIDHKQDKINIIEVENDPIIIGKNIDIEYQEGVIII
ncbi:MAG: CRISPR-associated endonuclease Cas2 [Campylobacterota bacterium]|nr:CRISPR-associated endonuclease Cas2 [Campylobacterota bacterium]